MPVTVVPMRKRGVPINPHMREAGAYVGRLRMYDYDDPVLHRRVQRVDLVALDRGGRGTELLPGLLDVTLVTLNENALVLTGFERLPLADGKQADYAQSWWVQLSA
jgi:hypothetical protein